MDGKLTFTVSGFYATRENVSVAQLVETPQGSGTFVSVNVRDGNQLVRGAELDVNWRMTEATSLTVSFGHVYSVYTDFGSANPLAVGRKVQSVSPQNGSISLRYGPRTGVLKNFSTNIGVTHVAATPGEAPNAGDTYFPNLVNGQRVLQRTNYQWQLETPEFTLVSAGAR